MTATITSIKDPRVELARSLQTTKGRMESGKCLLYGLEQIKWGLGAGIKIESCFGETAPQLNVPFYKVSSGILKKISGTNYVVPYLAVAALPEKQSRKSDFVIVLDNVQDFGNIGSIMRTAQSFSVDQFMFVNMQADPFQRKVIDASRGTVFTSHITNDQSAQTSIENLKKQGYQIVVTSPHAKHLQSQTPLQNKPIALIVGNETSGACDDFMEAADVSIQIPMSPHVESLNVSVASGISIYELKFKQVLLMLKEKIFTDLGRQVNVTGMMIRQAFDVQIRKHTELTGPHVILLMIMHLDKTMTTDQIFKDMALFAKALDEFLKPLLEKKYISTQKDLYSVTSEGENFLAQIWPIVDKTYHQILSKLTSDEIEILKKLLNKVQDGCQKCITS